MARLDQLTLTATERAELTLRQRGALIDAGYDAFIAVGSANIVYLSGVVFPYLDQEMIHPVALFRDFVNDRHVILCTFDVAGVPVDCGWDGEVVIYELTAPTPQRSLAQALVRIMIETPVARIGFDDGHMKGGLHDALAAALPVGIDLVPGGKVLSEMRMIKTPAEVRVLEATARIGDRGVISALNHAEGAAMDRLSFPMWEFGERLRVHVGEFDGSGTGNLSMLQGKRATKLYSRTGVRETFNPSEFLRMEYSCHNHGYWISGTRTVYNDRPHQGAREAYADNLALRTMALSELTAGRRACDVYDAVARESARTGIRFWDAAEVGFGVGTAEREAPYLVPWDKTVLRAGMVVTVGVYTYGTEGELICNRDVYAVTEGQPELLSWYKHWSYLYSLHGTSARHG